jgi:hypothetical protein
MPDSRSTSIKVPVGSGFIVSWSFPPDLLVTTTITKGDGSTRDIVEKEPADDSGGKGAVTLTVTKDGQGVDFAGTDPAGAVGPRKPPKDQTNARVFKTTVNTKGQALGNYVYLAKFANGNSLTVNVEVTAADGWVSPADEPRKFLPAVPKILDFNYATDDADFKSKVKVPGGWNGILQGGTPDGDQMIRDTFVEAFRRMNGFGSNDSPKGRARAYLDAVYLAEPGRGDESSKADLSALPEKKPGVLQQTDDSRNSSCAIFIRIMWRLLGVDDGAKQLDPPYNFGGFSCLAKTAKLSTGAYRTDLEKWAPLPGDCAFILSGTHQHIFTVLSWNAPVQVSMDGGQIASDGSIYDGKCMSVRMLARKPQGLGTKTITFPPDQNPRQLNWWCDITKLKFSRKVILPKRIPGNGIPDPHPRDYKAADVPGASWPGTT